jgi:hypothetical protein
VVPLFRRRSLGLKREYGRVYLLRNPSRSCPRNCERQVDITDATGKLGRPISMKNCEPGDLPLDCAVVMTVRTLGLIGHNGGL